MAYFLNEEVIRLANEKEAIQEGLNVAKANATKDEQQKLEKLASALENSESDLFGHQSIDEYNHI